MPRGVDCDADGGVMPETYVRAPEGVVGFRVYYGSGMWPSYTDVAACYYCERCDEAMMLAWQNPCPICGSEMDIVLPSGTGEFIEA